METEEMTPIKLLRMLFNITAELDDYQVVVVAYQESEENRIKAENLKEFIYNGR